MPRKVAEPRSVGPARKPAAARKSAATGEPAAARKPAATGKPAAARKSATTAKSAAARRPAVARRPVVDDEDGGNGASEVLRETAAPARPKASGAKLVQMLNESLGWELRAQAMYAHYAAYVKGLESLTLAEHFEGEVTESVGHAKMVRDIIAALGGEAVTTRDTAPIVHTGDTREMLEEGLKTESAAAAAYRKIIPLVKDNASFYHTIYHILRDETEAVIEMETLLGR